MTRASPAVLDGRKVALVVGNGAYQHVERLAQAPKDADLVAVSVRALGFEVVEDDDVTRDGLRRDIVSAKARMKGAAVGFFYYSGHGMQIDGENYLVPVDAALATQDDVPLEAVDVNEVLRAMETSGSQLNVAVLDACRNNPWASSWFSDGRAVAANRGLADMAAPAGFLLAFATGPDHVAPDDGSYAQALVAAMATPGLEIDRVFRQVYAEVHV